MSGFSQHKIEGQNILLVIAHPDDEAMFFAPTITNLRNKNQLYLLCLSNGNFMGLGKQREKELERSRKYLGFKESTCIDDPKLQDGMKTDWDTGYAAQVIKEHMQQL